MAKYHEIFTKDKEKQTASLGQCEIQLVRGFSKNNTIYHRIDIVSKDNVRLLSQFIQIENLGYYLHLAGNNNSFLNEVYNKLSFIIDTLKEIRDVKVIKKDGLIKELQDCANMIESRLK